MPTLLSLRMHPKRFPSRASEHPVLMPSHLVLVNTLTPIFCVVMTTTEEGVKIGYICEGFALSDWNRIVVQSNIKEVILISKEIANDIDRRLKAQGKSSKLSACEVRLWKLLGGSPDKWVLLSDNMLPLDNLDKLKAKKVRTYIHTYIHTYIVVGIWRGKQFWICH